MVKGGLQTNLTESPKRSGRFEPFSKDLDLSSHRPVN
jgi:hypothetical protein